MSQLPAGSWTLHSEYIADASTAVRRELNSSTRSVIVKCPASIAWAVIKYGDGTVVATKGDHVPGQGTIAGYPIDEPRPEKATHVSILTSAAGEILFLEKTP